MKSPLTVAQLNKYVNDLLENDSLLNPVLVKGELSGVKSYPSGHFYFTLKDSDAAVSCVLFKGYASRLRFRPESGQKVILTARANVYGRDGRFQLLVMDMSADGLGDLHLAFEQLKQKLDKEGLFAETRKKPIPYLPQKIGVVTSPAGAVIRDIIQVLGRRFPNFNLQLIPVPVQGEGAAQAIAAAIRRFNEMGLVDVLIVGRGGGSLEDLWPFNEEIVARALAASRIPVISAVGHETDFTICDFVADLRAPTPSAAAELAIPVKREEEEKLVQLQNRLAQSLERRLSQHQLHLGHLQKSAALSRPWEMIDKRRQDLDRLLAPLQKQMQDKLQAAERTLSIMAGKLDALSPLRVLARGYAAVRSAVDGRALLSTALVRPGDLLDITISDGTMRCQVKDISDRRFTDD